MKGLNHVEEKLAEYRVVSDRLELVSHHKLGIKVGNFWIYLMTSVVAEDVRSCFECCARWTAQVDSPEWLNKNGGLASVGVRVIASRLAVLFWILRRLLGGTKMLLGMLVVFFFCLGVCSSGLVLCKFEQWCELRKGS